MLAPPLFNSLYSCFYTEESRFNVLAAAYRKNMAFFKGSLEIKMPDFWEIEQFFVSNVKSSNMDTNFNVRLFFKGAKSYLIWLFSSYEILTGRSSFHNFSAADWRFINTFIPYVDISELKTVIFRSLKHLNFNKWENYQDELLKLFITRKFSEKTPFKNEGKISWAEVARELNKNSEQILLFKTDKQCKERWFNHLNPILVKKEWTPEEDTQILIEFQKTPKQWSKISRKLVKRNEHQAKNRFIWLMAKEICCTKEEIRGLMNENSILGAVSMVLESLEKSFFEEKNLEKEKMISQINEMEYNIDRFINF